MAKHLARIHGTEEDRVNCPFYFKIGACRHGDRCSRLHNKPAFSPTILIKHIYRHPNRSTGAPVDPATALEDFLVFYEDFYMELSKYGRIEHHGLNIVDNVGDHMIGHCYVKFTDEEEAADALEHLHHRYYDGIQMECEFSPVTDFREARCRDYDEGSCSRAGFCNFLHCKPVPECLVQSLEEDALQQRRLRQQEEEDEQRLLKRAERKKRKREKKESSKPRSSKSKRSSSSHHRSSSQQHRGSRSRSRGGSSSDEGSYSE